jgi:hypothetical protein
MPPFPHLPLGQRIPASPHAVSCSLPRMRDVRGYEEKDPETMRHLTSGYPRFVVHPFTRELVSHDTAHDPELEGRTLWLTTSARMSRALADHLGCSTTGAEIFAHDGLSGVSHPVSHDLYARAKTFLQNIGGFLSSREAEASLVRLGLRSAAENILPVTPPRRSTASCATRFPARRTAICSSHRRA